ncbi:MAG: hypothetical protein GY859_33695, partial [Desulfobacterales bacterium]|nr:hypothetical protein [Desulfobacterales bacterium]
MRYFHSYGPVDRKRHFCVQREKLLKQCVEQLIDDPDEGGHYFTIWAPRQNGKTWLMRRAMREISKQYEDKFSVYNFSLGNLRGMKNSHVKDDITEMPRALSDVLELELPGEPILKTWKEFSRLFSRTNGSWDRPLILLIDEVDTAPPKLLDLLVGRFREMYQNRDKNWLHGLALIGVRAVLGVDSKRGSPFNVQKSLRVSNLTHDEVREMYRQYQEESDQRIEAAVVDQVFRTTNGQPGLVSWFGELLTDTYNPGDEKTIDMNTWRRVWMKALFKEPNNTVMNLVAKARDERHQPFLLELFTNPDIPFSFDRPIHNYMHLHGVLDSKPGVSAAGVEEEICCFSSPFIQRRLYEALGYEMVGSRTPILALEPLDKLLDVFEGPALDLPALLRRYKDYLVRLKNKGMNPWKDQPRRKTDFHLTEAVGHFHLYAWLLTAVGRR